MPQFWYEPADRRTDEDSKPNAGLHELLYLPI